MFSVGDKVIYGNMGVCTVTDIAVPDLPGATKECYVLKPHYVANSTVYAPVGQSRVRIRALLTQREAEKLIDSLPELEGFAACGERQALQDTCRNALKSADSLLLAKLLKTLYDKRRQVLQQGKTVSSTEKEYFATAEQLLFGEMAIALGLSVGEVGTCIMSRLAPEGEKLRA